jgi:hypothetical protein
MRLTWNTSNAKDIVKPSAQFARVDPDTAFARTWVGKISEQGEGDLQGGGEEESRRGGEEERRRGGEEERMT